jgi:F0F1-type ATP synthase membrane subunit b/b'
VLGIPPLLAVIVGYMTSNRVFEYGTLAAFAALSVLLYTLVVELQGKALSNRELAILEAVKEPADE